MSEQTVFYNRGIRVELPSDDHFLMVAETLERMGVANHKTKTLYQSCHILHKRQEFAILHFKELFELDGRESNFNDEDRYRRNRIAKLLEEWGLVRLIDDVELPEKVPQVKVLPFKETEHWNLVPKYKIGSKKRSA